LVFPFTVAAALGVWAACGGSDAQDVTLPDAGTRDSGPTIPPPEEVPPAPNDDGGQDSGTTTRRDAGARVFLDGGVEGGIPCYAGGELEEEPNNTNLTANRLRPIRCGVTRGSAGSGEADPDVMTFTIGDASASFYLQYEGNVSIVVETDGGAPVDISQPGVSLGPVRYNQPYFARVTSKDGNRQVWNLVLFEDK